MDKECEEFIVRTFFKKNFQERVLFELLSPKRRKNAIGRLSHNWKNMLNEKYMMEVQKPNSDFIQIAELLKKHGAEDICYSISFCEEIDGKYLPLLKALESAVGFGLPSIISCKPGELAYFESEQEYAAPPRLILKRNK